MKLIYLILSWGLVALGAVHMLATPRSFESLTSSALWFASGGIAIALAGVLNLLNRHYGRIAPGLRRACFGANLVMTAFGALTGTVSGAGVGQFALVLGLCGGATVLSLIPGALKEVRYGHE
jgi:hypothetical protein